ncbi:MAG TPA: UDP-glucose 4-epimerase GalE [Dehalococcoidia bacterium]
MRVLVTGGAGYVGSVTVAELVRAGHDVAVYDNLSTGHAAALPAGVPLTVGELGDAERLDAAFRAGPFDAVMHFAGLIAVGESMAEPGRYFQNNVADTITLVNAALCHGVRRFVFSSSAAVYGVPETAPIPEDHPIRPINVYGETKAMVERILAWYGSQAGLASVCLRYFNAAGATEDLGEAHDPETHLIPLVLQVPLGRRPAVRLFGTDYETPDGTCVRDYIHVSDLAQAHVLALERCHGGWRAYNLGNGRGFSNREVIEAARRVTGHPIPVEEAPRRPGDPPVLVAAAERARRELGWEPRVTSLDAIVESAWRWHRAHPDGYPPVEG